MSHDFEKTKYTLLTNIDFVQLQQPHIPLRLDCHALLIEEGTFGFGGPVNRLRGFGTDGAWPVFSYWLEDGKIEYTLTQKQQDNSKLVLTAEDKLEPLFLGAVLTFGKGPSLFLQYSDAKQPIDVHKQTGKVLDVWSRLFDKTARYWQAPHMPRLIFGPPR